ncbi:hypothetical protein Unana1_03104 [Umbelopsis nana]
MMENGSSHNYSDNVSVKLVEEQNNASTENSEEHTMLQHFFAAASEGNIPVVQQCLEQGCNVNGVLSNGRTSIYLAIDSGNAEVVSLLLEYGANIQAKNEKKGTALHYAAKSGNPKVVSLLLDYRADINAKDMYRRTALHDAAESGNVNVVSLLLEHRVDIHAKDVFLRTALHYAAKSGNLKVVSLLLEYGAQYGADIHTKGDFLPTLLNYAAAESRNPKVVSLILEHRADIHAKDVYIRTAFLCAAISGNLKVVSLLLEYRADIHTKDDFLPALLHYAANSGSVKVVSLLLEHGVNIHAMDSMQRTALHFAGASESYEVASLLLEYGADIHARDDVLRTALHYTARSRNPKVVSLLLEYGANIHAKDKFLQTVLHHAVRSGNPNVVSLLLEYGADIHAKDDNQETALHYAARSRNVNVISILLEYRTDIHAKDDYQQTVLHHATLSGSLEVVSLLLKYGADIHAKDDFKKTALHYAAQLGNHEVVSLLLAYGADIHAKDDVLQTGLQYAVRSGKVKVTSLLLEHGADIHARDRDQLTALHNAAESVNPKVVPLLLNSGAKVNATTFNGSTALHLALASRNEPVALALLDGGARADVADDSNQTPLRIGSRHSIFELIPALVRNGADINEQSQNGSTVLLEAAERGDTDLVSALLEQGANTEIANNDALTPLFVASNNGCLGVISLLLSHGTNKDTTDQHLWTALHRASERGDLNVASALLKGGFDTEVKNAEGDTALHIAAQFNHLSIVIALCQLNADINATDHHGLTVLHRAVHFGRKEIVSYLMDAGAKLGNSDNGIDTLLYVAAQAGQAEIAEVALGSRFYTVQAAMDTRKFSLFRAAECGHTEVVNVLLQHGVDIESTDAKGWTALHKACYASKMETARSLIQQGADKEAKDKENGWTSLFLAAKDPKIILLLIAEGADIEAKNGDGLTALHYYTSIGQVDAIHLLLNYGCNIESRDLSGHNALHYAAAHNQAESMKILLDNGLDPYIGNSTDYTAFHQSAQIGNEKMMKVLLDSGFNVDTKGGPDRMTALLFAILHSNLKVVQFLLAHGASVNTIDNRGRTSLHYAAKRDALEIAEMLLNSGVAVNALDDFGESALDVAAVDDNLSIVAILVRSCANVMTSVQPNEGRLAQYRTRVVRTIEQTASNEVFSASAPIRHDKEDMILSDLKVQETLVILKEKHQPYPSYGSTADGLLGHPKKLESVLGSPTGNWAIRVIACLLETEDIRLYTSDQVFALKLNTDTYDVSPKWAFHVDKMKGIIRKPGFLIVQIPQKRTRLSVPGWFNHDNTLLRLIDAVYVSRRVSDGIDQDAFSEVLGGQEQKLSIHLHATLVAALGIASMIGGPHIVHRIVDAVLKCGPDYAPLAPAWPWKDWQALNRVRCPCEFDITHGPLTPVAAAKAIGINVWRERKSRILPRVWDLTKDQLVKRINVADVVFITHQWDDGEIVYEDVANPIFSSLKKISLQSPKLKRIRDTLLPYTQYVWLDTICIDKSNLSELDENIRSMYRWYSNCKAVVLDSGTTLGRWKCRGWCLQEGAAAGTLYGMSEGKLVSIQTLAKTQDIYLCKLDLSLYYRRGNAVEILSRMDMRKTTRIEDMAYALAGIFSIHLTLAYGEEESARERLLQKLATQKGDLSFLSFPSTEKEAGSYLPTCWQDTFRIAHCIVPSTPTLISHLGLTMEAQLVDGEDAMKVLATLNELKLLKTFSKGRYVGLKGLNNAATRINDKIANHAQIAIVQSIRSVLLIEVYDSDFQTGGGVPIKCCTRIQCCQVEENEFQRLFSKFKLVKPERIWLGDKQSIGR